VLKFGLIRWKNLLSTGNVFTEIDLAARGTTLIIGYNGGGKSTLLDALSFVLYGKPFRKVTKPQLPNSINKKDMLVECEFTIGDVAYLVRRGMKPNVFEVWQDGLMLDQHGSMTDLQEYLERNILKINHRACMQVVVLGATFVQFMDLPAGHRREILEDILDIKFISAMNNLLKGRAEATTRELREADSKRVPLVEMITMQEGFDRVMEEDRKERIKQIEDRIAELEDKKTKTAADGLKLMEESASLKLLVTDAYAKEYEAAKDKLAGVRSSKSHATDRLGFFEKNNSCPTCEQDITADHKHTSLEGYRLEIELLTVEGTELTKKIAELKILVDENIKKTHRLQQIVSDVAMAKRMMTGIDSDIAYARKEMAAASKVTNRANSDLAELKTNLELLDKNRGELMKSREVEAMVSGLLKDSGVKAMIVRQYIPIINKLINKYLAALDFFTSFELDEEFNERILARHRDDFTYHSFSEGEKQRIDLAILFTWRAIAKMRNSAATNIVIMDEIFDSSLDTAGAEDFTKLLGKLTEDTNAIIISHRNDQISDKFDRIIHFEKHKNFSRMI